MQRIEMKLTLLEMRDARTAIPPRLIAPYIISLPSELEFLVSYSPSFDI